jgi:60 kDa SS-A/Ro ribonucleoprotein
MSLTLNESVQMHPIVGKEKEMIQNNAGGYGFKLEDTKRVLRFFVLGSESNYYKSGAQVTMENLKCIENLLKENKGLEMLSIAKDCYTNNRVPKLDPLFMALATASRYGTREGEADNEYAVSVRRAAFELVKELRTLAHVYTFLAYRKVAGKSGGWNRMAKSALINWVSKHTARNLLYQGFKYMKRNDWSLRDVLRCVHMKPEKLPTDMQFALKTIVSGFGESLEEMYVKSLQHELVDTKDFNNVVDYARCVDELKKMTNDNVDQIPRIVELIHKHRFTREFLPTWALRHVEVWNTLLLSHDKTRVTMPITALVRNLGVMTERGVFNDVDVTNKVVAHLQNKEVIKRGRVHPVQMVLAWFTYEMGHGVKGKLRWETNNDILKALEAGFYVSFGNVQKTGLNILHALDASGSMSSYIAGLPLSALKAVVVMAMCFSRSEDPKTQKFGIFSSNGNNWSQNIGFKYVDMPNDSSFDTVRKIVSIADWGCTNCTLPVTKAIEEFEATGKIYDAIIMYTDHDTNIGRQHLSPELKRYRKLTGKNTKFFVIATTASGVTVVDPKDEHSYELVGFDTEVPNILHKALTGEL